MRLVTKSFPCIILVRGPVGEIEEVLPARFRGIQRPEVAQVLTDVEADGPVVVAAFDGIAERLSLRMTLNAGVVRVHAVGTRRIEDFRAGRLRRVRRAGTVALLASHVPLGDLLRAHVVFNGVAAIARRSGRPLQIVPGIVRDPPVGVVRDEVPAPEFVRHVPLRSERKVVVAHLS